MSHPKHLIAFLLLALAAPPLALSQEDAATDAEKAEAKKKKEDSGGYAGYTDTEGRDEEYWAKAAAAARDKELALRLEVDRLENAEAALKNEFYAVDDPHQREKMKSTWDESLNRLATIKAELEKAQADLENLEREARQSGALPGWLRESKAQRQAREDFESREPQKGVTARVDPEKLAEENKAADEKLYGKPEGEEPQDGPEARAEAEAERREAEKRRGEAEEEEEETPQETSGEETPAADEAPEEPEEPAAEEPGEEKEGQ